MKTRTDPKKFAVDNLKCKVAIFHFGFFYSGGGEKLVLEEVRGLRVLGHDVVCYAPYVDRSRCFPGIPEMAEIRALLPGPPRWLPVKDPIWILLSCLLVPLMAWRFRSYDVMLGANQPGCWFAYVLSKMLRKPYVAYLAHPLRVLHPRPIDQENGLRIREGDHHFIAFLTRTGGWFIDWADRASVREADVVLTNGEHVSRWIREVYRRDNAVCAAGCHPAPAEALSYSDRWSGDLIVNGHVVRKPYVLLTNRHVPQKHFEYAIWALKGIHKQVPGLSLIVTGQETEYTAQLKYLTDGLGLHGMVHFIGLVKETDLANLYRHAALYVYPSPEEDFGMGIVEAMAMGTPVVAWNNGGPTVTVANGETGFLIEPYDTDEFAARILELATDRDLAEKMGRAGNRMARERFSYEQHIKTLETALVQSVFSHRAPSVAIPSTVLLDRQASEWMTLTKGQSELHLAELGDTAQLKDIP